jgi:hypothetical protein
MFVCTRVSPTQKCLLQNRRYPIIFANISIDLARNKSYLNYDVVIVGGLFIFNYLKLIVAISKVAMQVVKRQLQHLVKELMPYW